MDSSERVAKWMYDNSYLTSTLDAIRLELTRIADSLEIIANAHIHEDDKK